MGAVTIKWEEHGAALKKGILEFLRDESLVDTSITFRGERFKAHRLILAIFLPVFRQSPFDSTSDCVAVSGTDASNDMSLDYVASESEDVQALVEFIYTGRVTVPEERLVHLSQLATDLEFHGLVKATAGRQDSSRPSSTNTDVKSANQPGAECPIHPCARQANNAETGAGSEADDVVSAPISLVDVTFHVQDELVSRQRRRKGLTKVPRRRTRERAVARTDSGNDVYDQILDDDVGNLDGGEDCEGSDDGSQPTRARRSLRRRCKVTATSRSAQAKASGRSASSGRRGISNGVQQGKSDQESIYLEQESSDGNDDDDPFQGADMWTCKKCGLMFLAKRNLDRHRMTCGRRGHVAMASSEPNNGVSEQQRSKNFKCHLCSFAAHLDRHLRAHVLRMHGKSCGDELQFECKFCDYRTANREELKEHTSERHKEDFFKCQQCKFASPEKYLLRAHMMRMHMTDKTYKCLECEYSSMSGAQMKRHVSLKHLKEKNHMCEMCGKRFQSSNKLNAHVRFIHHGIRQYKCKFCDQDFNCYTNFKVHVGSKHTGDVTMYMCDMCGKSYNRRWNLHAHMMRVHGVSLFEQTRVQATAAGKNSQQEHPLHDSSSGLDVTSRDLEQL